MFIESQQFELIWDFVFLGAICFVSMGQRYLHKPQLLIMY